MKKSFKDGESIQMQQAQILAEVQNQRVYHWIWQYGDDFQS